MIKKFNKHLLENHPLVWNTRMVWMLGIMAVMHLVFFLIGYFSYFSPVDLHSSNLFDNYLESGFVWIGILLSILIFILWMNQYFKQNAFKSQYPKSNFSLYKEFLIIFLISFLGITQYLSYTKGLEMRVAGLKTSEQLEKEIDLTNRAAAFALQAPYYRNDGSSTYDHQNRCLDVPIFDSLVSRDKVLKLYVQNQIQYGGYWQNVKMQDYLNYRDSIQAPLYGYSEYTTALSWHFPERENWIDSTIYNTNEVYEYGYSGNEAMTAPTENSYPNHKYYPPPVEPQSYNLGSIYNYCGVAVYPKDSIKNRAFYAKETHELLKGKQKAKIENLLNDYTKLADEYEIGYRFKDKQWIDYVYNPPYYFVNYELTTPSRYSEAHQETFKKDYFAQADLENSLNTIKEAKSGVLQPIAYLIFLYIGLGIALLIYTFRTSTMRTWVISIVGSMVIFFIYFCIYFLFGMIVYNISETSAFILFLLFIATFFTLALSGILTGKRKLISGVNLNWSIWTFGAILPICVGLYTSFLEWKYPYDYKNPHFDHPHKTWINANWETIFFLNLILVLIFMWLIIPVVKKWKAMPEE